MFLTDIFLCPCLATYIIFSRLLAIIIFAQLGTSVSNFCVTAPLLYDYVRSVVGRLYDYDLLTRLAQYIYTGSDENGPGPPVVRDK